MLYSAAFVRSLIIIIKTAEDDVVTSQGRLPCTSPFSATIIVYFRLPVESCVVAWPKFPLNLESFLKSKYLGKPSQRTTNNFWERILLLLQFLEVQSDFTQ